MKREYNIGKYVNTCTIIKWVDPEDRNNMDDEVANMLNEGSKADFEESLLTTFKANIVALTSQAYSVEQYRSIPPLTFILVKTGNKYYRILASPRFDIENPPDSTGKASFNPKYMDPFIQETLEYVQTKLFLISEVLVICTALQCSYVAVKIKGNTVEDKENMSKIKEKITELTQKNDGSVVDFLNKENIEGNYNQDAVFINADQKDCDRKVLIFDIISEYNGVDKEGNLKQKTSLKPSNVADLDDFLFNKGYSNSEKLAITNTDTGEDNSNFLKNIGLFKSKNSN